VDYSEKVRSYAKSTYVSKNTADTVLYTMAGVVQAFFFRYTFLAMSLFFSAWQLVIRRSLANWRLLSFMMVGVLVAVALLSSTPLYSNALNDLGLAHALREKPIELLDVHIYARNYQIDPEDYNGRREFIDRQASQNIGALVRQEERYIKSQTFYAAWADRPIPPGSDRPKGYFQVFTNLEKHITLLEGHYPDPFPSGLSQEELADPGLEIEAMIGSEAAETFGVGVGDRLLFTHPWSGALQPITIKLTGIIDPIDPKEEFWFLNTEIFTGPRDEGKVAPLFIPEQTLFEGVARIAPLATATYHWFYYVDPTKINTQNAESIKNAINRMDRQITAELPYSSQLTITHVVISTYEYKLLYTQIPLFLLVVQIVGIVLYYLVTIANMVIEQQSGEIALLRSRGASTGQIFSTFFMEGLIISAFGGAVGPFLGAFVFSLLGKTTPFLPLTGGGLLPIRFSGSVFLLAAGAAVLCLLALLVPAIQAARRGVVHQRQHVARPPRAPFWQRFYLDLVMLVLGGVLYWELRARGSLLTPDAFGGMDMDPLLLVTPLLLMVAVAIVFLRLFPIVLSLAARLSKYVTNAPVILGLRYMARNPVHYGRPILLLMMAASVGMFSASFIGTVERSYNEQAAYSVGSDVRLENLYDRYTAKDTLVERYSSIPGVEDLSIVYRGTGTIGGVFTRLNFTMLAIDPESFRQVAWYRDDFSGKPLPELMNLLAEDQPIKEGLELPEGTEIIGLWACPIEPHPGLVIYARVKDGLGYYIDCELGSPASEGWQYLEASLRKEETDRPLTPPLSLQCIYARVKQNGVAPQGVYLDDLQVRGSFYHLTPFYTFEPVAIDDFEDLQIRDSFSSASSDPVLIDDFEDVLNWTTIAEESSGWAPASVSGESDTFTINNEEFYSGAASGEFRWVPGNTFGYRAIYPNLDTRPLVLLASRSLLDRTDIPLGSAVYIRMHGPNQYMPVVIKDVVDYFPTLNPGDRQFMIANLDRLSSLRNLVLSRSMHFYPNEVWLTVTGDEEQKEAVLDILGTEGFRARELYDQAEMIAESKADPLEAAGWGGILLIAFLGVTLVSGLGFAAYAYLSARGRRLEFAILRTLGFSLRQIIGLVCLEQLFVIGTSMGIGTFIGLRLGFFMMLFLQFAKRGEGVLPPVVLTTDWFTMGIAYIALTVAFIATIALVILFFSRVALHRTLRIGDM